MTHGFKGRYSNSCRKIQRSRRNFFKMVPWFLFPWLFHIIVSFLSSCHAIESNGYRFAEVHFEIYIMHVKARTCVRDRTWAHQLRNRKRAIGGSITKRGRETAASYKTKRKCLAPKIFVIQSELESCRHFLCNIFITYCSFNVRKHDSEIRNYVYNNIYTYISNISCKSCFASYKSSSHI